MTIPRLSVLDRVMSRVVIRAIEDIWYCFVASSIVVSKESVIARVTDT